MHYVGNLIRPPSEADALILQVTVGCPYNRCTFCGAYKDVPFQVKDAALLADDLAQAQRASTRWRRVFLADGDVLALSQGQLVKILATIGKALPEIRRISLYGSARSLVAKGGDRLAELRRLGLDRIYLGLESGCDEVLRLVAKGTSVGKMVQAGQLAREAGIFLSVTALLGLGGTGLSGQHARRTARVLREMAPQQIALLTLMPIPGTPLAEKIENGEWQLPGPPVILAELEQILTGLEGVRCQFHANHASSYLPLSGRLPRDREKLLNRVAAARQGELPLVPDYWRAL